MDNLLNKKAPKFNLQDTNGNYVSIDKFIGQWLVIFFYPKDNTPGCTKEACLIRDDYAKIKSLNTEIIGINTDNLSSHLNFKEKYHLPFTLLSDPDGLICKKYDALMKFWFIKISKRRSVIINPEGMIKKIYPQVSPSQHSLEIIKDITLLQSN